MQAARFISTSYSAHATAALTEIAVEGDAEGLLKEIDRAVSAEGASAKDVADAAVALAYVQAKGNRRCVCRIRHGLHALGHGSVVHGITAWAGAEVESSITA